MIIMGFDIARTGMYSRNQTIAISACVINDKGIELDHYSQVNWRPDETISKTFANPNLLKRLTYTGPLDIESQERYMVLEFQNFRRKWESIAFEKKEKLILCSNNCTYNCRFISELLEKHSPNELPIPYTATHPQIYGSCWDTNSMQKAVVLTHRQFKHYRDMDFGLSNVIEEYFSEFPNHDDKNTLPSGIPDTTARGSAIEFLLVYLISKN